MEARVDRDNKHREGSWMSMPRSRSFVFRMMETGRGVELGRKQPATRNSCQDAAQTETFLSAPANLRIVLPYLSRKEKTEKDKTQRGEEGQKKRL